MSDSGRLTCPGCEAVLDPEVLRQSSTAECPFCGQPLGDHALDVPESAGGPPESGAPPTRGKGVQVIESTPERLVLFVPAGTQGAGGLGCFAILWNGFMVFCSTIAVSAWLGQARMNGSPLMFVLAFSLFWLVGLGLAAAAIRMKYERTLLLVTRDRAVMQKNLWGWKRKSEVTLDSDPVAELVESYSQNDVPVYRIEVGGSGKRLRFGTGLAEEEKNRTVDLINEFFGGRPHEAARGTSASDRIYPDECEKCGAPLPGEPVAGVLICGHCQATYRGELPAASLQQATGTDELRSLRPDELSPGTPIVVEADATDRLVFTLPSTDQMVARYAIPAFTLPFSLAWYAGITTFVTTAQQAPWPVRIVFTLFSIPFFIAGALPLGMGLFLLFGRMRVSLDRDQLTVRWFVGPLGYSRRLPTAQLQSLQLEQADIRSNPRIRGARPAGRSTQSTAVARTASASLLLTLMHSDELARDVISLLSTRLADWGVKLRGD